MKPYHVEYVQLASWEADVVGLWLAENEDWLLLRSIPVDYVVDGYVLVVKAHITSRKPKRGRKQLEQVLKLKSIKAEPPIDFCFTDVVAMLQWVEQHYKVVEFADQEDSTYIGWVQQADTVHFWLTSLKPDATVDSSEAQPFVISEVQIVHFDTDYTNSLKLLWQHKSRQKLLKPSDN